MSENVRVQRVRIIREIEAAAAVDRSGRLPWRPSWSAYFGSRDGLLDALATRRRCLEIINVDDLPAHVSRPQVARQLHRTNAGLDRILTRYAWSEARELAQPA